MKLSNLLLVLVTGLIFCSTIMAAPDQDPDFTAERDREIGNIKERMQISEERLNCLQKAKDFEALKSCNQAANKKMDALEAKIKSQPHSKKADPDTKHPDAKNKHN
jgi:Skp family chaperone for outer membrane proteins